MLSYLLTDPDLTVDYIDEDGNFRTAEERPPFSMPEIEGAEVEVRLSDEESRLNINALNVQQLLDLFEYIGVPTDERQPLVDSLLDWKDPDDEHHLSGAEDEYYESFGYSTKDRPLDMPEELLLIKGFTKEHLYGSKDLKPLEPIITTHGAGMNVNTVSAEVLRILGVPEDSITNLMIHRAKPGGTNMVPPDMATFGRTTSSNLRIQIVAKMSNNPLSVRITSVVRRDFGPKGAVLTTLYWKEDIESSGT